jgi:hypothetical protein
MQPLQGKVSHRKIWMQELGILIGCTEEADGEGKVEDRKWGWGELVEVMEKLIKEYDYEYKWKDYYYKEESWFFI